MTLKVNCYLFGDNPKHSFTVKTVETEIVDKLKEIIKMKKASKLEGQSTSLKL